MSNIQNEIGEWLRYNFPYSKFHHNYLGLMEELGELAHVQLKYEQGMYPKEYYKNETKDAIGDMTIFLHGLCIQHGLDFMEVLNDTWAYVKTRNADTFYDAYQRKANDKLNKDKTHYCGD